MPAVCRALFLLPLLLALGGCGVMHRPAPSLRDGGGGSAAPDYADSTAWLVLPGHPGRSREQPPGLPPARFDTVADVFFVHPTTYVWQPHARNAPLGQPALRAYTQRVTIRNQASIFAPVGRLYAPAYRQAALYTFFASPADSAAARAALEVAYADVRAAFRYYLAHYNRGRPFIVAAHSQGTFLATRLLHELVDDDPRLRARLVAAYLVGFRVRPAEYRHLPALPDSLATGGILAWNTARYGARYPAYAHLLATNPLTWTLDSAAAPAALNRGAVPTSFDRVDGHLTGAAARGGLLWVQPPARPGYPRILVPALRDSYHIADYNLFYLNVRQNARARIRQWAKEQAK